MKKLISVCIPCRNEAENVKPLAEEIIKHVEQFQQYNFEVLFSDNCSTDGTQNRLREICSGDKRVKAILNARNFPLNSAVNLFFQAKGNCVIFLPADFQVPLKLIPEMLAEWEKGTTVVALVKKVGKHDKLRLFRKLYYKMADMFSGQDTLSGFTGNGLYDRSFVDMCKELKDPLFSIQSMIVNYAATWVKLRYDENPRRSGKSNNSFFALMEIAVMRFTRVSDIAPRYAIYSGIGMGIISFFISIYYLVRKLLDWHNFPLGIAPIVIGVFFLGAVQLIFIGLIGEYVIMINERQKNKPLVVEKERINFDTQPDDTETGDTPNETQCKN